ncbi:hypothetical protein Bca52824_049391 [Brassica carinata]|uniref:Uncharacterized protein n=1 Tax=Brassica carinata TaxID=52824 RepID=A0A8X7UT04_BRACI|nr:hypothetical protein Bca52824_049391 [Brassica carinata]
MVRQQRASKVHEDRYPSSEHHHGGKDELVKRDMLDPPSYLRRRRTEDICGKALSFGVLDWKQFEDCKKVSTSQGTKGAWCNLETGVVKRLEPDTRHDDDVQGECSSSVNVIERNQNSLLDQNIPTVTSKKERNASPNRRFSFSFSQMSRSFSSKESSSSVHALSSTSHASAKSCPLTFNNSVYTNHSTRTKPNVHTRARSGPLIIPKTEKNQYQFVVDSNVLAATMKSSDSSTRSYTLYTIKEVKNKSGNWLGRHKNDHPFVHTVIGQMKTNSDSSTCKSESVLFGVETNKEVAAIVQTRNRVQKQSITSVILPSGVHTLPKDGNIAPLPLIKRWESGGSCDCGGWDIGCKLRVLSNDHRAKSQTFSSFQLFDQERDEPAFKMVTMEFK